MIGRGDGHRRVYFAKPIGMDGPIKIGCSDKPANRILSMASWVPFPLEIVATVPGGFAVERNVQECFTAARLHSEWFKPVPELVEAVAKLAAGVPLGEAIDLSKRTKFSRRFLSPQHRSRMSLTHRMGWALRRADRENGGTHYFTLPQLAEAITRRWSRDIKAAPTPAELTYLDAVIAKPLLYCEAHERSRPKKPVVSAPAVAA